MPKSRLLVGLAGLRFLSILCHCIASLNLIHTKIPLIKVMLDPDDTQAEQEVQYQNANTWLQALIAVSIFLAVFELGHMFSGTLFFAGVSLWSSILHIIGTWVVLIMILDGWTVQAYIWSFCLFSAVPASADLIVFLVHMFCNGTVLEYLEVRI